MAGSINYVYNICRNILEKDARGFFTPEQFNRYAQYSQEEVFNDVYSLYTMAQRKRMARLEYKDLKYSSITQIQDDLRPCYRTTSLTQASANTFSFPSDYKYLDGITYSSIEADTFHTGDTSSYVLNSNRVAPTTAYPAALIGYDVITMYPTSITSGVSMGYYKIPRGINASGTPVDQSPTWAYTTVAGQSVYNASSSIQFELPESTYNKIIVRILQQAGMSIRESEVVAFAQNEELEDLNQN